MNLLEESLENIIKKKADIQISVSEFIASNEKAALYYKNKISALDLIKSITHETPYTIFKIKDLEYLVASRESIFHPLSHIPFTTYNKIWERPRHKIIKAYPELKNLYNNIQEILKPRLKERNSIRSLDGFSYAIIEYISTLDGASRDLSGLKDIWGDVFNKHLKDNTYYKKYPVSESIKEYVPDNGYIQEDNIQRLIGWEDGKPIIEQPDENVKNELDIKGPREGCVECVLKHIGQAIININESLLGYPEHKWIAVAHMSEASEEMLSIDYNIANLIRDYKLKILNNEIPVLMELITLIENIQE